MTRINAKKKYFYWKIDELFGGGPLLSAKLFVLKVIPTKNTLNVVEI